MLVELPLHKTKYRIDDSDEEEHEEEMNETQQLIDSLHDRHRQTQEKVDWNTIIAYVSAGIGIISLIIAIITIILMVIDRKRIKICLESNKKSNLGALLG